MPQARKKHMTNPQMERKNGKLEKISYLLDLLVRQQARLKDKKSAHAKLR